jgi:hypothetical protein
MELTWSIVSGKNKRPVGRFISPDKESYSGSDSHPTIVERPFDRSELSISVCTRKYVGK